MLIKMTSKSVILNLLIIILIADYSVPKIEARWALQHKPNRPTWITALKDTIGGPIIKKSEPKSGEEIKTGMDILESMKCGKSDIETTGMQKSPHLLEFPWMAMLIYFDGSSKIPDCDGSLISDKYVLTAANCIRLENKTLISVRLGEYDSQEDLDCTGNEINRRCASPVQEIDVEEAIYHRDYDPKAISFANDIGLVRLKTKAIFQSNVRPICLPITQQSKIAPQEWMLIFGWNHQDNNHKSNLPFKAVVPLINNKQCEGIHVFIDITEKHWCVGDDNLTKINSYCKGDSGTPMFRSAPYGSKTRFVQYGIVSLYGSFCNSVLPHLYVKIEPYLPWIAGNIRY